MAQGRPQHSSRAESRPQRASSPRPAARPQQSSGSTSGSPRPATSASPATRGDVRSQQGPRSDGRAQPARRNPRRRRGSGSSIVGGVSPNANVRLDPAADVISAMPVQAERTPRPAAGPSIPLSTRTFGDLGVPDSLVRVLTGQGITHPFPIQEATMVDALAGLDLLGRGRTGSGKTIAFALPMLTRLATSGTRRQASRPRGLVLVPTRELANQVHAVILPLAQALGLRTTTIFGGVGANPQIAALRAGVDIVVACPGRLEDHMQSGHVKLDAVEVTVLDEADHMCDLGFLPAVVRLLGRTPANGQRMLFSATLDKAVDSLVARFMTEPVVHSVDAIDEPPVEMDHHVFHLDDEQRLPVLVELATRSPRTVMFTRTKHRAKTLTRQLNANGIRAVELHGNLAQAARERNLAAFSSGAATTLVATDIAARGIHVDDIMLVIHADPPIEHKAYLHRSGRTARAGAAGTVITLMTNAQVSDVRQLTRKAGINPTTTRVNPRHPIIAQLT